jgi:hypothetical protein
MHFIRRNLTPAAAKERKYRRFAKNSGLLREFRVPVVAVRHLDSVVGILAVQKEKRMKILEISEVAPACHSNVKLVETAEVAPTCHNNVRLVESAEIAPTCH